MAAFIYFIFSGLSQTIEFADAFFNRGYGWKKSLKYLKTKDKLLKYKYYCRFLWLQQKQVKILNEIVKFSHLDQIDNSYNMQRRNKNRGLDFARMEAAGLALEAFELDENDQHKNDKSDFEEIANPNDIEIIQAMEIDLSFYEYEEVPPAYHNDAIQILKEGVSYTFIGYIHEVCERFSINFLLDNETKDVALHINPRIPHNYIVRNSKVRNIWGVEEVTSTLPFLLRRGNKFSIQVLVTYEEFKISVNGYHYTEYRHRLPFDLIRIIEIKGDVDILDVLQAIVTQYPDRLPDTISKPIKTSPLLKRLNLLRAQVRRSEADPNTNTNSMDGRNLIPQEWRQIRMSHHGLLEVANPDRRTSLLSVKGNDGTLRVPYYGSLPKNTMVRGCCLRIDGRVKLLPHSFYINLQSGQHIWPHPTVAFHFNPRFFKQSGSVGKAIVVRNAWMNGKWSQEDRSELDTDFYPGKTFSLTIICTDNNFEVFLNEKLLVKFKYRIDPNIVDTVYIRGDIKLWKVSVESALNLLKNRQSEVSLENLRLPSGEDVADNTDDEIDEFGNDAEMVGVNDAVNPTITDAVVVEANHNKT